MFKYVLSAWLVPVFCWANAQSVSITGVVKDSATGEYLPYSELVISPDQKFVISDEKGKFSFVGVKPGKKELRVRHVGCNPVTTSFYVSKDTQILVLLSHHHHQFETHVVYGHHAEEELFTDHEKTLSGKTLRSIQHQSMGEILTSINGVYALKTGQAIAKPVIRGLQGNRIIIADNGLKLESQQWGDEHAPEMDSRGAASFKVLKGAGTLRYGYDAIGGIILADPGSISDTFSLLSGMTAISNGRGLNVFSKADLPNKRGGWQLSAGIKKVGDQKAPDYFLSNTGYEEITGSVRNITQFKKMKSESVLKYFYNKPGILKASHIGNITDLNTALSYAEPLVQLPFSYKILRPFQQVTHVTGLQRMVFTSGSSEHTFQYGLQLNHRKEYDNRRGGDKTMPQLNFFLQSHQLEWNLKRHKGIHFQQMGVQSGYQTNLQKGFLLIPNFRKINQGIYYIHRIEAEKLLVEAGLRADAQWLTAFFYSESGTLVDARKFAGLSGNISAQYQINHDWMLYAQLSHLWRAPSIHELHSNGLHHGAAALEYGDTELKKELAYTAATTIVYNHNKFGFEMEPYIRYINRFISLQPQFPPALTIRGAFPVFKFQSNDVRFVGIDAQWNWVPFSQFVLKGQYSIMQVRTTSGQFLNGMPPASAEQQVKYLITEEGSQKQIQLMMGYKYFFKQMWADPNSDYMPPPNGYGLLRASISADLPRKYLHTITLSVENMLNTAYRDYLSRLRFYADEPGFGFFLTYNIHI